MNRLHGPNWKTYRGERQLGYRPSVVTDRCSFVSFLPPGTSKLRTTPRLLGARLTGVRFITPNPIGLYVHSVRVEFDELLDSGADPCREIPLGSFPYDPQPAGTFEPLLLAWLPTRVINAGGYGVEFGFVNDTGYTHALLTRFVWEGPQ